MTVYSRCYISRAQRAVANAVVGVNGVILFKSSACLVPSEIGPLFEYGYYVIETASTAVERALLCANLGTEG